MRAFLIRVGRFGFFLLILGASSRSVNAWLIRYDRPALGDGVNVLILGDSHVGAALDPSLIPGSRNVALIAEPYMASYFKVSSLLENNPALGELVLGFGPHNIAYFNDEKFSAGQLASEMFGRYYALVPWWKMKEVRTSTPTGIAGGAKWLWSPNVHLVHNLALFLLGRPGRSHPYMGDFMPLTGSFLTDSTFVSTVSRHFSHPPSDRANSQVQEGFLRRIVDAALNQGLRVTLVATPKHERYRNAVPPALAHHYQALWNELVRLPGVTGLDLSDLELSEADYWDYDHVSVSGARRVSDEVARHLREIGGAIEDP